jgi:glutamyl/glutaminyl-tRNA synthetase
MTIRTRFAPSPTGYLHIGGVRTALFNWLLVKRRGGQFVLRIDDTDEQRNKTEALQPILDGFRWLGLNWDEGPEVGGPFEPYFQSQRRDRYRAAAMRLLESGHAYPDYMTKEELDAERKAAEAAKRAYVHRGPHRDTPPAECLRLYREKPTTLRFKVPAGDEAVVEDRICGRCVQKTDHMGDAVILRADGSALYNFASVVDDIDFKITDIVRAREHLTNSYTQVLIFKALGAPMPRFGHVPVINEPNSNKKLSKRDMKKFLTPDIRANLRAIGWSDEQIDSRDDLNPVTVAFYKEMGYLPEAVVNYLGRLGWSLDDKTEFIPIDQMTANFGLDRVNDSPARFDPVKLHWLAGEYMKIKPLPDKVAGCTPYLVRAGMLKEPLDSAARSKLEAIITAAGDRMKLYSDIIGLAGPFFRADPVYDSKSVEKRLKKAGAAELLRDFAERLKAVEPFDAPTLDKLLHDYCTEKSMKVGEMVHPLRVSTTGVEIGFGLFDSLAILGRDEALRRIELGLKQ